MNDPTSKAVKLIRVNCFQFEKQKQTTLRSALQSLANRGLPANLLLVEYHDLLLFMLAHPHDETLCELASKELARITRHLKGLTESTLRKYENSGLPFTRTVSTFSHDFLIWLTTHADCNILLEEDTEFSLSEILGITLPDLEKNYSTAGYNNQEILQILGITSPQRLGFYLDQFGELDDRPLLKDLLFDKLKLQIRITPRNQHFSRAYNKLSLSRQFLFKDKLKNVDAATLIHQKLPRPIRLNEYDKANVIQCIKNAMALTARETDPITYLDPRSLKLYFLERGVQIALYTMRSERQLPLESYVGYMLFRNGYPLSYGGGWIFGYRANFGINIFDWFRGGESGYVFCQLLRTYHQVFKIGHIEVEPYQFGLDNPDGIKSGAFWFYYRFGFRPADTKLKLLADKEWVKINSSKKYKSSREILKQFTESNLVLRLDKVKHPALPDLTGAITNHIIRRYNGNRSNASHLSFEKLLSVIQVSKKSQHANANIISDFALLIESLNRKLSPTQIKPVKRLISWKARDPYVYQALLRKWLDTIY